MFGTRSARRGPPNGPSSSFAFSGSASSANSSAHGGAKSNKNGGGGSSSGVASSSGLGGGSGHGGKKRGGSDDGPDPLDELRDALTRIESIVEAARVAWWSERKGGGGGGSGGGAGGGGGGRGSLGSGTKRQGSWKGRRQQQQQQLTTSKMGAIGNHFKSRSMGTGTIVPVDPKKGGSDVASGGGGGKKAGGGGGAATTSKKARRDKRSKKSDAGAAAGSGGGGGGDGGDGKKEWGMPRRRGKTPPPPQTRRKQKGADRNEDDAAASSSSRGDGGDGRPAPKRTARFVPLSPSDEEELVELLRRTAELVVRGERLAAAALSRREKRAAQREARRDAKRREVERKKREGTLSNEASEIADFLHDLDVADRAEPIPEGDRDEDIEAHIALFEHFCERNALPTIVNIVTGAAFGPDRPGDDEDGGGSDVGGAGEGSNDDDDDAGAASSDGADGYSGAKSPDDDCAMLPPLTVATQAVQSVSILIQNVSRATSLYFLLSNNRVNDLIDLPLRLYAAAERRSRRGDDDSDDEMANDGGSNHLGRNGSAVRDDSAEMAELSTHFVSFLKSLAMRMNAETLQFFLTYPPERKGGGAGSASHFSDDVHAAVAEGDRGRNGEEEEAEAEENKEDAGKDDAPDDERARDNDDKRVRGTGGRPNGPVAKAAALDPADAAAAAAADAEVDFPLYARALEFCSSSQSDSFVRVTAMNICLNTLRLATVGGGGGNGRGEDDRPGPSSADDDADDAAKDGGGRRPDKLKSPDGSLRDAAALPLRERLAIARHVCNPRRVERLVSPIFTKLAQMCGMLEGTIRALDALGSPVDGGSGGGGKGDDVGRTGSEDDKRGEQERQREEKRRERLSGMFRDIVADLQDELLLLDDVLKVGLTSLNEQTIEMMLATFIYPLLLQPLLLYGRRFGSRPGQSSPLTSRPLSQSSSQSSSAGGSRNPESRTLPPVIPDGARTANPFSVDSLSDSLARSGLLGDVSSHLGHSSTAREEATTPGVSHLAGLSATAAGAGGVGGSPAPAGPDPDPAPAKTAFFGLSCVFHFLSNRPLLHLLLAALFHPLAPDASKGGGAMVRSRPDVATSTPDGRPAVRVDGPALSVGSSSDGGTYGRREQMSYSFGRRAAGRRRADVAANAADGAGESGPSGGGGHRHSDRRKKSSGHGGGGGGNGMGGTREEETCVYVLSPSLAEVLEGPESSPEAGTRPNPYRRVVLACLGGADGMPALRPLAIVAVDSALSVLKGRYMGDILFGTGSGAAAPAEEEEASANSSGTTGTPVDDNAVDELRVDGASPRRKLGRKKRLSFNIKKSRSFPHALFEEGSSSQSAPTTAAVRAPPALPPIPNDVVEIVASLFVCVINATLSSNGLWRLKYDRRAAHALLCAIHENELAKRAAYELLDHRRRQSASFLAQLPACIDSAYEVIVPGKGRGTAGNGNAAAIVRDDENDEVHVGTVINKIFHDPVGARNRCVVEMTKRRREAEGREPSSGGGGGTAACSVPVALESSFDDLCNHLCTGLEGERDLVIPGNEPTIRCVAASAYAHLQLDALTNLIKDAQETKREVLPKARQSKLSGNGPSPYNGETDSESEDEGASAHYEDPLEREEAHRTLFAPLSRNLRTVLLGEETSMERRSSSESGGGYERSQTPKGGSIVGLVGRAAFPCVCEVAASSASLFADEGACVVAEGVKWQSLYMVILGRYMILAEPEKGGSGGNGRIVTSCRLSCLTVEKDTPPFASTSSPARRLLLSHASMEPNPPGVFNIEILPKETPSRLDYINVNFTHSSMDLWFEDDHAADRAFQVLAFKIAKAKSRRGIRIREALACDQTLRNTALFSNGS